MSFAELSRQILSPYTINLDASTEAKSLKFILIAES